MIDDDKAQSWCSEKLPCARYEAQAAEIERLREALREVRSCTGEHYGAARALKIIRAALGETE